MSEESCSANNRHDSENQPLLNKQEKKESFADLKPHLRPLFSALFISVVAGLNDGSLGAIIPTLKNYYDIPNETISLLFLSSAFGFFISAALNGYIVHRIGQLKTLYLGSITLLVSYSIIAMGFPFIVMAGMVPFVGAGMALLDAAMNVFVANLPLATLMLNILHAVYGVGAMVSPLVASFLLKHDVSWRGMYLFLLVIAVINLISIAVGFKNVILDENHEELVSNTDENNNENSVGKVQMNHGELTKLAIFNRMTLIGAAYILVYVGVEVTLGGWGFTFLTEGRHGSEVPMARVVSAYWAGLAIGRILLGYLCSKFGEKLMIILFTLMIIGSLVTMIVSSEIISSATAFISIGLLLGPMFPTTISLASKVLPRSHHSTAIGFMAALGAGGAAFFPFLTGQIAGHYGILIMPAACIVMTVGMLVLWMLVPSDKPLFAYFQQKRSA